MVVPLAGALAKSTGVSPQSFAPKGRLTIMRTRFMAGPPRASPANFLDAQTTPPNTADMVAGKGHVSRMMSCNEAGTG